MARLLVVDDEPSMRVFLEVLLTKAAVARLEEMLK